MAPPLRIVHVTTPRSQWTAGSVYGLGDPLPEARILDRPLSDWRRAQGAEPFARGTLTGPALVLGDDVWISDRMIRDFARAASERGGDAPVRLMRDADGPGRYADPLSRLPRDPESGQIAFDVWYLGPGVSVEIDGDALPAALEGAVGADVAVETFDVDVPVDPEVSGGVTRQTFAIAPVAAAPVAHWAELHRANLLALGTNALEAGRVRGALTLLWAVVRAMSLNPHKVMARLTRRGRGCRVHPRAVVEGCTLGDGVEIDAGAVLRGCFIGDGAKIGANVVAEFSVIGAGARVTRQGMANLSVIYPDANIGGFVQLSLAGQGATTKIWSLGIDMRIDKPVRVQTPDGLKAVDIGYLGVCFGHRAFVASGVWIAPGRVIAPRRRVLRAPGSVVLD